jgi:hypothetical protein
MFLLIPQVNRAIVRIQKVELTASQPLHAGKHIGLSLRSWPCKGTMREASKKCFWFKSLDRFGPQRPANVRRCEVLTDFGRHSLRIELGRTLRPRICGNAYDARSG